MLTLLQIYGTLKNIADAAQMAKELPALIDQIQDFQSADLFLIALERVLQQQSEILNNKGINLHYRISIFKSKLTQHKINFDQLPVTPEILYRQIGTQIAGWVLEADFLWGIDIGVDVDTGWAEQVTLAACEQYASLLFEKLFNKSIRQELSYIAQQVSENPQIKRDVKQVLELQERILAQREPDTTILNASSVQTMFGVSPYLVDLEAIQPADQARLGDFYQGKAALWWDILLANGDVERDLQEQIASELNTYPDGIKMLCITGETGSGKSTFAWRVAKDLSTALGFPILQLRDNESIDFWYRLENGLNRYGKPVIVLVDDVFRGPNILKMLRSINLALPVIIIATSRSNEIPDAPLPHFEIQYRSLKSPTNQEINRALEKTRPGIDIGSDQLKRLRKATSWLVLMCEMTTGEEFSKWVRESTRHLHSLDATVYRAYEYVCFAGQFDVAMPTAMLERLDDQGEFYQIAGRPAARGLINFAENTTNFLRPPHPIIAKFALEAYHRNPRNILSELIQAHDPSDERQAYFIASLLLRMTMEEQAHLVRTVLRQAEKWISLDQLSIASLSQWVKIYEQLGEEVSARRWMGVIREYGLAGRFSSLADWIVIKNNLEADESVIQGFMRKTAKWLEEHPEDSAVRQPYLSLTERKGTPEQVQGLIQSTAQWLEDHPKNNIVRQAYIGLVERKGTPEQVQKLIGSTSRWLEDHPNDSFVRQSYLNLVEHHGTSEQILALIQSTVHWLENHPNDNFVRQFYLGLVERKGTPEQVQEVIWSTAQWLDNHLEDNYVRQFYTGLVERKGTYEQVEAALQSIGQWLEEHPEDCTVRHTYLGLVERNKPEQVPGLILSAAQWLQDHPEDSFVRLRYLGLVKRKGSPEQIRQALQVTIQWLQNAHLSEGHRQSLLNALDQMEERKENPNVMRETDLEYAAWLRLHPEGEFVRRYRAGVREKALTGGMIQQTLDEAVQWLQRNPDDLLIRRFYLKVIQQESDLGPIQEAIQSTTEWLQNHCGDSSLYQQYLGFVGKKGNPSQTRAAIEAILAHLSDISDDSQIVFTLINLIARHGTLEQVKLAFRLAPEWLEARPEDHLVRQAYWHLVGNFGDRPLCLLERTRIESWIAGESYARLDPLNKALILTRYGKLLLRMEDYPKAEEISKSALQEYKGVVPARINLAWSLYHQNKKGALNELKHALWWAENKGRHPASDVYYHLGRYWFQEKDYLLAEENFNNAIRKANTNPRFFYFNPYLYYLELGRTMIRLCDARAILALQTAKRLIMDQLVEAEMHEDLAELIKTASKLKK